MEDPYSEDCLKALGVAAAEYVYAQNLTSAHTTRGAFKWSDLDGFDCVAVEETTWYEAICDDLGITGPEMLDNDGRYPPDVEKKYSIFREAMFDHLKVKIKAWLEANTT